MMMKVKSFENFFYTRLFHWAHVQNNNWQLPAGHMREYYSETKNFPHHQQSPVVLNKSLYTTLTFI